jgi:AcrR family transcriptional regulator
MAARASASRANKRSEVQSHKLELRTEVQEFKRRRILEQSRELFFEQGYEATTLDTIAAQLKVTKPFLYSYFRNKSEILNAICEIGTRAPLAALDEALATKLPPAEKLRLAVERVTTAALENQQCIVVYCREEMNLDPEEAQILTDLKQEFDRKLSALLQEGAKRGEFTIDDADFTALSIAGLIHWAALWWRPTMSRWSQTDVVMHMIRNVERMVGRKARVPGAI